MGKTDQNMEQLRPTEIGRKGFPMEIILPVKNDCRHPGKVQGRSVRQR
jgi:hypothetical protein